MRRGGWHILREDGALTLTRRLPPRFDIAAEARLPAADPLGLAWQIRQDLWRALRRLRGFSPVVTIAIEGPVAAIRAGGRVIAAPPDAADRVQALLDNPGLRRRWLRCAKLFGDAG